MRGSHAVAAQSDGVPGGLPGPAVLVVPSLYHALLGAPVHTQHERVWFGDNSFIGLLRRQPDQHDQSDIPGNFLGTSRGPSRSPCLTTTLSRPWDVLTLAERTNSRSVTSAEPRRHPTPAPHQPRALPQPASENCRKWHLGPPRSAHRTPGSPPYAVF